MKKKQNSPLLHQRACFKKACMIMKLTTAFLIYCLTVSAGGFSQTRITVHFVNTDMQNVIEAIEKGSGYRFLYSQPVIKKLNKVTLTARDEEVLGVVTHILSGTGISYE